MSFAIATTGLNAITEQLNIISNNIANSKTTGFKSSTTQFMSLYAQKSPLGVAVGGTSQSMGKDGALEATGNTLDLATSGGAFFVVRDSSGDTAYTRAGSFEKDIHGNLLNKSGMKLQGYPVDADGNLQEGKVEDLKINTGGVPAKATSKQEFVLNLNSASIVPTSIPFDPATSASYNYRGDSPVMDSQGNQHTLSQYFVKTAPNSWNVYYTIDNTVVPTTPQMTLTFDTAGVMAGPNSSVNLSQTLTNGAANLSIAVDYSGSTQFNAENNVTKNKGNGHAPGIQNGQTIAEDGSVYATFSNGERMLQGKLAMASFANPNGLSAVSGTSWKETTASGTPLVGAAGTGQLGKIQTGVLEASNVDLTAELVGLMTAQRNYQANTKIISANDSMMNALFQVL
jgi:flagellar hook protein FlgE